MSEDPRAPGPSTYRLWPRWAPGAVELGGAGIGVLLTMGACLALVTALLCIPIVARTLGLPPRISVPMMAAYYACMVGNDLVLHPWALRSPRGFDAQLVIVPLYNVAFLAAFVLFPNDPRTPLWMGLLLYSGTTASWQEIDKSWLFLAFHASVPLLTIPVFLARGAPLGWSIAGPLLCSLLSAISYHLLAVTNSHWRRIRAEQARTIAELRARAAELERQQLAQDLHDSVGSALGLVGLYGDLVERHAREPGQLLELATTLREAAREGLGELRGVLDAMAPERGDLVTLAENLRRVGTRAAAASGAVVEVALAGSGDAWVDGPARLALVRVFQEAVANALRHGKARRIRAELGEAEGARVRLLVEDDGAGFEAGRARAGARGLAGMRRRAEDLGGRCDIETQPGAGARIVIELPRGDRPAP
ncbi:two-component system sensor kinase [Minicystis rosea]|nr:two-component system sensor kinase [Minicystis rosea]